MNLELPIQKFVCNFQSRHLCAPKYQGGEQYWTNQYQKRFVVADNIEAAKDYFIAHFQNETFWPKGYHEVVSFSIVGCQYAERYVGYDRFSIDVRTEKGKQEMLAHLNSIQEKVANYLEQTAWHSAKFCYCVRMSKSSFKTVKTVVKVGQTMWGTSNFVSKQAAIEYYAGQGYGFTAAAAVEQKLKEQEIAIGEPTMLKKGDEVFLKASEGRYWIVGN